MVTKLNCFDILAATGTISKHYHSLLYSPVVSADCLPLAFQPKVMDVSGHPFASLRGCFIKHLRLYQSQQAWERKYFLLLPQVFLTSLPFLCLHFILSDEFLRHRTLSKKFVGCGESFLASSHSIQNNTRQEAPTKIHGCKRLACGHLRKQGPDA